MKDAFKRECLYGLPELKRRSALLAQVSLSTVRNWVNNGVTVRGRTVKLAARRVGRRWQSSLEAVERFYKATNAAGGKTDG